MQNAMDKVINSLQGSNAHCWVDSLACVFFPIFNSCESMEKAIDRDEAYIIALCHNFTLNIWQRFCLQSTKFRYDSNEQ